MSKRPDIANSLTFGFEQTYTIPEWWTAPGFTHVSDTQIKRAKMLQLAEAIADELSGSFKESVDIWNHMQYEVFDEDDKPSFVITMDPGSIEVKTPPSLFGGLEEMAEPLVVAAEKVGLVPYRNWWYGVKGGTEGGCHVNMGGFTKDTNPLKNNPDLVIKYSAYLHNRPWLTYPFMGPDVGPEGNAMRMDEKDGYEEVKAKMNEYIELCKEGKTLTAAETYKFFSATNLVKEKSSAPSLYKFKGPLFFIEDRAQESLRSAEEFKLVANLRLQILKKCMEMDAPEPLQDFEQIHKIKLTSYWLWGKFIYWANDLDLNPIDYQRFFERQFPKLFMGTNQPSRFGIKEGRRPRKITDIQKRGDVVTSKTVDTSYKRFELYYYTQTEEQFEFLIDGVGVEHISPIYRHEGYMGFGDIGQAYFNYFDIKFDKDKPVIKIELKDKLTSSIIDRGFFNINDMQWCEK
jgi:hypothetical protein